MRAQACTVVSYVGRPNIVGNIREERSGGQPSPDRAVFRKHAVHESVPHQLAIADFALETDTGVDDIVHSTLIGFADDVFHSAAEGVVGVDAQVHRTIWEWSTARSSEEWRS